MGWADQDVRSLRQQGVLCSCTSRETPQSPAMPCRLDSFREGLSTGGKPSQRSHRSPVSQTSMFSFYKIALPLKELLSTLLTSGWLLNIEGLLRACMLFIMTMGLRGTAVAPPIRRCQQVRESVPRGNMMVESPRREPRTRRVGCIWAGMAVVIFQDNHALALVERQTTRF